MFFLTWFVCLAAFLVYTVMSSQLTKGPSRRTQEQEACTPMEHQLGSACLLFPFLYFSACLSLSTSSTSHIPEDDSLNKDTIYCSIHLW